MNTYYSLKPHNRLVYNSRHTLWHHRFKQTHHNGYAHWQTLTMISNSTHQIPAETFKHHLVIISDLQYLVSHCSLSLLLCQMMAVGKWSGMIQCCAMRTQSMSAASQRHSDTQSKQFKVMLVLWKCKLSFSSSCTFKNVYKANKRRHFIYFTEK